MHLKPCDFTNDTTETCDREVSGVWGQRRQRSVRGKVGKLSRRNIGRGKTMNELEMRVEVLSEHVARLEGVIDVMLQEAENGTLEQAAAEIRAALAQ